MIIDNDNPERGTIQANGTLILPVGFATGAVDSLRVDNDLVLVKPDGTSIRVENYFGAANPPRLLTDDGELVTPEFTPVLAALDTGDPATGISRVTSIEVSATITESNGSTDLLSSESALDEGSHITTEPGEEVELVLADGTRLTVLESTRLSFEILIFDPETGQGMVGIMIQQGQVIFLSGAAADTDGFVLGIPAGLVQVLESGVSGSAEVTPEISTITLISTPSGG